MGAFASALVYTLEDVPGKGKGLIAASDIPMGTRIISEKPFVTVPTQVRTMEQQWIRVYQQVLALSVHQKREFLAMDNVYPYTNPTEEYHGIFRTNALPIGSDLGGGGVFLHACRINHACDPNATNFWNENLDKLTIHAIRDIQKGEEITISYLEATRNKKARAKDLKQLFKFVCLCQLCSLPRQQSKESDKRLDRVHQLDNLIEEAGLEGLVWSAQRLLGYVDEQVQLWNEETSKLIGLTRAYPDAVQIAIANGDLARGLVFAERALALYRGALGDDSPDVAEYKKLVRDPATHEYYGMSMQWKTAPEEIPMLLEVTEAAKFEDWLWRRGGRTVR
ncbi:SET domain-containing protein [Ophiobolus disseminans]|uniref:SET domain-containing protein n=1 Tax=Ophiobolus disseminans TaxID=1469910 RepID=A0A6A6ZWY7_9PLEO|nr:SET domain-containing protein [Ophiobolus disseminans]